MSTGIGLFANESGGFFTSHSGGLDQDQIQFLQSLRVGDRLAMFRNEREGEQGAGYPKFTLKKSTLPARTKQTA